MDIHVLYYGILREKTGLKQEHFSVEPGTTVDDLAQQIGTRHPAFTRVRDHIKFAVNEDLAATGQVLAAGDNVALLPPIAGGSDRYCVLTDEPLRIDPVLDAVTGAGQGGSVIFVGTVRNENDGHDVTELHYEAYDTMVLRTLNSIIDRCERAGEGIRVAVAHRTGTLRIGDAAVVIAASAPHRAEAFTAARDCIELLKQEVPIWKKEFSSDGANWVGIRP